MTRIDQTAQLAALIRSQIGAQLQTPQRTQPGWPHAAPATRVTSTSTSAGQIASLQEVVALRVRALGADDPHRHRKAFRIFLEATLLQEFGRDRVNDPGFGELIDEVMIQMESDPALGAAMHEAGGHLLATRDDARRGSAGPASPDRP